MKKTFLPSAIAAVLFATVSCLGLLHQQPGLGPGSPAAPAVQGPGGIALVDVNLSSRSTSA